jgi:hypothetical protein
MRSIRIAAAALVFAVPLAAQGNISTQGYGYPTGQLSSRALSMGGSLGEVDPGSALNPAAIGRLSTRAALFQIEPEYRTVKSSSGTDHTTTARYPLINIGVPFGERWVFGVSAATLLDRTWATSRPDTVDVSGDLIPATVQVTSQGAINELRLSAAWTNRRWLLLGGGVSAITGRNALGTTEQFEDSAFNNFNSQSILSYSGSALSAGAQVISTRLKSVFGLSYRLGNSMHASKNDTVLARGDVPSRLGFTAAFTGIQGTILSARVAHDEWSKMTPMLLNASTGEEAHDSWELGAGIEATGPRVVGQTIMLRAGGRSRTLPFEAAGQVVSEKTASFGTGANFGGGRMSVDAALLRHWRNADIPTISERAWTFSLSLTARP